MGVLADHVRSWLPCFLPSLHRSGQGTADRCILPLFPNGIDKPRRLDDLSAIAPVNRLKILNLPFEEGVAQLSVRGGTLVQVDVTRSEQVIELILHERQIAL